MGALTLDSAYRRIDAEEFLDMDFGGAKAELEDGLIFMMAGGSVSHAAVAANILIFLGTALRGKGCRPFGSDLAVRTGLRSIRFPDVSVYCGVTSGSDNFAKKLLGDPKVIFEVLSPSTASLDQGTKLEEYKKLTGVETIVLVDSYNQRMRLIERVGSDWADVWLPPGSDAIIGALRVTLSHADVFSPD